MVIELYQMDKKLQPNKLVKKIQLGSFRFVFIFYERKKGLITRNVFHAYLSFYTYIFIWLSALILSTLIDSIVLSWVCIILNFGILPYLLVFGILIDNQIKKIENGVTVNIQEMKN